MMTVLDPNKILRALPPSLRTQLKAQYLLPGSYTNATQRMVKSEYASAVVSGIEAMIADRQRKLTTYLCDYERGALASFSRGELTQLLVEIEILRAVGTGTFPDEVTP